MSIFSLRGHLSKGLLTGVPNFILTRIPAEFSMYPQMFQIKMSYSTFYNASKKIKLIICM